MSAGSARPRTAHPYRDTDVIDSRAPRANQTAVGVLATVAVITGWWPLLGVLAAQLAIGLVFGRRFCLPCLAYFELIQPRLGEGPIEDSRPPRFANLIGAIVLGAATLAHLLGLAALGSTLAVLVAVLALLAAITGLCVGCQLYRVAARLRGFRAARLDRVDLEALGYHSREPVVVQFSHPLCTDCGRLERELRQSGRAVVTIDVSRRRDLARRYGIALVPTAVAVDEDGRVTQRIA